MCTVQGFQRNWKINARKFCFAANFAFCALPCLENRANFCILRGIQRVCFREKRIEGRYNWRGSPFTRWLYMLCRRYSICIRNIYLMYNYRVYNKLFILNISYTNGVPSAKHVYSYGRENRVSYISLLFLTPWSVPREKNCVKKVGYLNT